MFSCVKTGGAKGEEANNPYTNLRHKLNIRLIYVKRQHCLVDMCFTRVWTLFICSFSNVIVSLIYAVENSRYATSGCDLSDVRRGGNDEVSNELR